MSLANAFESQFRGDIRFRGQVYLKTDRVTISRVEPDRIEAVVVDGTEYRTSLERDEGQLRMACNCWPADRPSPTCKHLWATLLKVDALGIIAGPVTPGSIPTFGFEPVLSSPPEDYWDSDSTRDVYVPPPSVTRVGKVTPPAPILKPWEQKLQTLS